VTEPTRAPQATKPKSRWTTRRIVLAVVALYVLILTLLNLHSTSVNFVFFSAQAPLLFLIVLALGVGFALGWLFDDIRARRARK